MQLIKKFGQFLSRHTAGVKITAAGLAAVGLVTVGLTGAQAAGNPDVPDRSIYHIDIAKGAVGADTLANRSVQSYHMNKSLVNALLAVPTNGVTNSSKIAPGAVDESDLSGDVQKKLNAVGTGEPGTSYGCDGKVVDADHPAATCPGVQGEKGDAGDPATDVKGTIGVNKTFDPTTVAKIGGKFAENATTVGTFEIAAGTWKIDTDGFWTTLAAGPAGTRPQLALRTVDGADLGTIFPGEASPTSGREITGHATKVVTLDATTTVTVSAFGYNDDTSSAGSGRLQVTASVVATRG